MDRIAKTYGVNVWVVRKSDFEPGFLKGRIFDEPFSTAVKERLRGNETFALSEAALDLKCFENEVYSVLCMDSNQKE